MAGMQVHVNVETGARSAITGKSLGGTKHTLSVHGQAMTVLGLKFQLESLNDVDIPPEQQQLYSADGVVMEDEKTLGDYAVLDGDTVRVSRR